MNKPERISHPEFSDRRHPSLKISADDQKTIPRIAGDASPVREIEPMLAGIQTTHLQLPASPYWTLKTYPVDGAEGLQRGSRGFPGLVAQVSAALPAPPESKDPPIPVRASWRGMSRLP